VVSETEHSLRACRSATSCGSRVADAWALRGGGLRVAGRSRFTLVAVAHAHAGRAALGSLARAQARIVTGDNRWSES